MESRTAFADGRLLWRETAMVTYLDRVAIGTLAPGIRRDLGLTAVQMGWVFTAFYGLFFVVWCGLAATMMSGVFFTG